MHDITDMLFDYLEAKRHLWNVHFRLKVSSLRECSTLDLYEEIDRHLFAALVVQELRVDNLDAIGDWRQRPWDFFRITPREQLDRLNIMLSDPITDANRRWNSAEPFEIVKGADFGFVEFFDWNVYGHTSYPYFRMKIDARARMPSLQGREALCEVSQVRAFYLPPN